MRKKKGKRNNRFKIIYPVLLMLFISFFLLSGCQKSTRENNTLRMVTLNEPRSFDPYLTQPLGQERWSLLVFDGLWEIDNQGEAKENLAFLPEFSDDGKVVKVKLKKGVKWQDGKPFTAYDVEFTWRLLTGQVDLDYQPDLYPAYNYIKEVKVIDEENLIFYLKKPFYAFTFLFPAILPRHLLAEEKSVVGSGFWLKPLGTGPYRLTRWKIGKEMVFEANNDYFREKPKIKKIKVAVVFSADEARKKVEKGEVDLWQDIPEEEAEQLKKLASDSWVLKKYPVGWETIFLNTKSNWFKNFDFREAIFYGIDWKGMRNFLKKEEQSLFGIPPLRKYRKIINEYAVELNRKRATEALHRQGYKNIGPMGLWERKRDETFRPRLSFDSRFQFFGKDRYKIYLGFLRPDSEKTKIDLIVNLINSRMLLAPKEKSGNIVTGENFDLLYYSQGFYPHPLLRKAFSAEEDPRKKESGLNFSYYFSSKVEDGYQMAEETKNENAQIKQLNEVYKQLYKDKVLIPSGYTYFYSFISSSMNGYQPPLFWETSFYKVEDWELR